MINVLMVLADKHFIQLWASKCALAKFLIHLIKMIAPMFINQ